LFSTWTPKLIEPIRWLIIVGIAATLAQSVLFVISGPQSSDSARPVTRSTPEVARPSPTSVNAIVSRNLFGAAAAGAIETAAPARETRLPLELRGVFVGETPEDSAAIIAQRGKNGELFAIGAVVPGNAELREVHPDHVVLRRAGNLETLTFPEEQAAIVPGSADSQTDNSGMVSESLASGFASYDEDTLETNEESGLLQTNIGSDIGSPHNGLNTPRDFVDSYRDKLDEDPQAALAELGIAPVSVDGSQGYRLGNLAQSPYLSQTGLQPGDIVLSVNGSPVGNVQQDRAQIDSILNQGTARLEVQRGTRRFFVTASLKQ
jgi:general secretion pathway protein C